MRCLGEKFFAQNRKPSEWREGGDTHLSLQHYDCTEMDCGPIHTKTILQAWDGVPQASTLSRWKWPTGIFGRITRNAFWTQFGRWSYMD